MIIQIDENKYYDVVCKNPVETTFTPLNSAIEQCNALLRHFDVVFMTDTKTGNKSIAIPDNVTMADMIDHIVDIQHAIDQYDEMIDHDYIRGEMDCDELENIVFDIIEYYEQNDFPVPMIDLFKFIIIAMGD